MARKTVDQNDKQAVRQVVSKQLRRALMTDEERRDRRMFLRMATGITSRAPRVAWATATP